MKQSAGMLSVPHLLARRKAPIIAPDLLGYGNNPPWSRSRSLRLEVEVRCLLPMIAFAARLVNVRSERVPYTPFATRAA